MELPRYEITSNKDAEVNELSDSNFETNARALLDGYFKFLPSLEPHLTNIDKLTPTELLEYNDRVAQLLYGPRILDLFKNDQHDKIKELSEVIKEKLLQPKKQILESIDFGNLALLVIRPDAYFLSKEIEAFFQEREYEIVLKHSLVIDLKQYWVMYNDGFAKSNLFDFPTRTLIYTRGESKVLILHKKQADLQGHLNSEIKGSSGIPSDTPTLRGTVILNGFEEAKKKNEKLFYDSIDPIGMYRAITSGKIDSTDPYNQCDDPVLYYAGQGIHLPDNHELSTNIGLLLDNQQLEELARRFRK